MGIRRLGSLIDIVDAGEALQQTGPCRLIETLRIAAFTDRQRCIDKDLKEWDRRGSAQTFAHVSVGRDCRDDHDAPLPRGLFGQDSDPAHIFETVLPAETEVLGDRLTKCVPIQQDSTEIMSLQLCMKGLSEGGLPGGTQAREPEDASSSAS